VLQRALTAFFKQFSYKEIVSNTVTETNHYTEQFTKLERGDSLQTLTHCGRVTQICVFNTVKLGTSANSP